MEEPEPLEQEEAVYTGGDSGKSGFISLGVAAPLENAGFAACKEHTGRLPWFVVKEGDGQGHRDPRDRTTNRISIEELKILLRE